ERTLQPVAEVLAEGGVAPGQVRAEQNGVAGPVEPARGTDANAHELAVVPRRELLDDGGDGVLGVADRGAGRRAARLREDRAVGCHDPAGDLGAADVD